MRKNLGNAQFGENQITLLPADRSEHFCEHANENCVSSPDCSPNLHSVCKLQSPNYPESNQ